MRFESIIYTKQNGVAKIALNRPDAMNAFSEEMRREIPMALEDCREDAEVRAVVLTGTGRAFCAGGDLKSFSKGVGALDGRERIMHGGRAITGVIMSLEKPMIAMVNGFAVGAGCNLALACDIIIASEDAKFSQAFVKVGLIPDFAGLYTLPRMIGMHKAKELIFTGEMIDGKQAESMGLINKAVPASELESTVMALAERLAKGPTRAIGMSKVLLHRMANCDLDAAVELEAFGQAICWQTDDHKEGVKAFFEKRQPEFKGQ